MKRVAWAVVSAAIVGFIVWSKDPLNDTVNFIIAGSIPGTKLSIGLWSTLILAAILLWLVRLGFKAARLQMMEETTPQIKIKSTKVTLEEPKTIKFDHSKRSVIAAPKPKSASL